jgi:23S rRNA (uracil1939-C5)-methyltransferase
VDPSAPHGAGFHQERTASWVVRHARESAPGERRAAILDPPRQGLGRDGDRITKALETLGVEVAVLVSCDPDSFARDVGAFLRRGYELDRSAVLDFFPQTKHVESMARLVLDRK